MTLWDWSLEAWRRPGVEASALARQDQLGESVALTLWRAWAGPVEPALGERAQRIAESFETDVLGPLRQARRALRDPRDGFGQLEALKGEVRTVELAAERRLLAALEEVTPERGQDRQAGFERLDGMLGL